MMTDVIDKRRVVMTIGNLLRGDGGLRGEAIKESSHPQASPLFLKPILDALHSGEVVGLPSDTIYGLGCLAQNSRAVQKIYEIKERDASKPIAICVAHIADLQHWCHVTVSNDLLHQLLPGPVTLVFKRRQDTLNPQLNPGTHLVGVRIPDQPCLLQLCEELGSQHPLALTSANLSGEPSCLSPEEFSHLHPLLGGILDIGRLSDKEANRAGSTVVDLSDAKSLGVFRIIRRGCAYDATAEKLSKGGLREVESDC